MAQSKERVALSSLTPAFPRVSPPAQPAAAEDRARSTTAPRMKPRTPVSPTRRKMKIALCQCGPTLSVMATHDPSFIVDDDIEVPVPAAGEVWTAGAVVVNGGGAAFAQKRSPDRRLFPGTWDIVGGHVEAGETVLEALAREIEEETGWRLSRVRRFLGTTTWTGDDGGGLRHEADYLVEVDGDLDDPALEWSKHSAYGWFGPDDLDRLGENREPGEFLIHDLVARALAERPGTV